jgi:SAM-dependent methyltransferase
MAGSVTCVDLSRRRSLVNAWRHKECDNIRIFAGNFWDIEKNLPETYDCITLIGAFGYAQAYMSGTEAAGDAGDVTAPYTAFLKLIRRHLKPGGRLVIAIENRLGLKYWAGCREDHTGNLFEGLENYPVPSGVRTFSRPELEDIFDRAGFPEREFYYPYPDYKLPLTIYSDKFLPAEGELNDYFANFDRERLGLFSEPKVYDSVIRAGLFPEFSNSFLVIAEKEGA